jgi:hypothetical protein
MGVNVGSDFESQGNPRGMVKVKAAEPKYNSAVDAVAGAAGA